MVKKKQDNESENSNIEQISEDVYAVAAEGCVRVKSWAAIVEPFNQAGGDRV